MFSALLEALFAVALAPLLMVHHACSVVAIAAGRSVTWEHGVAHRARWRASRARRRWRRCWAGRSFCGYGMRSAPAPVHVTGVASTVRRDPTRLARIEREARLVARPLGPARGAERDSPDDLQLRADDLRVLTVRDEAARLRDLVLDPCS